MTAMFAIRQTPDAVDLECALSDMRLTPNDQPGDQKNQRQKNGRGNAQTASKWASLDLGEATNRRDMSCVCTPETIERQDPCNDAAVNQNIGNACNPWTNIEEEVLLLGQQSIASLRRGVGDDCVSCEKKDCAAISQDSRWTIRLSSCWI